MKRFIPFLRGISLKVNSVVHLKFKLTHFKATVHHVNHYTIRFPLRLFPPFLRQMNFSETLTKNKQKKISVFIFLFYFGNIFLYLIFFLLFTSNIFQLISQLIYCQYNFSSFLSSFHYASL